MREKSYTPRHASGPKAPAAPPREAERRPKSAPARPEQGAEPGPEGPKKKPGAGKALLRLLLKLGLLAAIGWALLSFVLGVFVVHSNDMYPALRDGDLLITYRIAAPARGEVVAYTVNGERRFGRVAGVAGDVIAMDAEGHYTVNGGVPYETIFYDTRSDPDSGIVYPYTVPAGTVFVLNDLRDNFGDSRRFGAIPLPDTDGSAALQLRRRGW